MKTRTDVPLAAIPGMRRRTDVPVHVVPGSSRSSLFVEWLGRLGAVLAIVLLGLTIQAIHRGLVVQASSKQIVQNFHTANNFFAQRADFNDPAVAREEMQQLANTLADLNVATGQDVQLLGSTLPDVQRLAAAGRGDVQIAQVMRGMGLTLQGAAGDLRTVAVNSNQVVGDIAGLMDHAVSSVQALNAQLAITERKLALVPTVPPAPIVQAPGVTSSPGSNNGLLPTNGG